MVYVSQTQWGAVQPQSRLLLHKSDAAGPPVLSLHVCSDFCYGCYHWFPQDAKSPSDPGATGAQSSAPASEHPVGPACGCTSCWCSPDKHLLPSCLLAPASCWPPLCETRGRLARAVSLRCPAPPCTKLPCHCEWRAVLLCHPAGCGKLPPPRTIPSPLIRCLPIHGQNAQSWHMCCFGTCWSATG